MKQCIIITTTLLMAASVASAALLSDFTQGTNLSSSVLTSTISGVDLNAGDVIVFAAATNKKYSVNTIEFTTTSGDSITTVNAFSELGGDPNPTAWLGVLTVATSGNFDFTATASSNTTTNWGIYRLQPEPGSVLTLLDSAAGEVSGIASGTADYALTYDWGGASYSDVVVIEAGGTTKGTTGLDTTTGNLIASLDIDLGGANRIIGLGQTTEGIAGLTQNYTFTHDGGGTNGSSVVVGVAIGATAIPEPSLAAAIVGLLGFAGLSSRRRR